MAIVTTIILLFLIALGLSLAFTPVAEFVGIKFGAMDIPMERKVHTRPIPRIGGLAVLFSFIIATLIANKYFPRVSELHVFNYNSVMGYLGLLVVFGCGLWDDFRRLKACTKLFFQIVAATAAFIGGASISGVFIGNYAIHFNFIVSYAVTMFWFLLFVNAVNLIDGLDGLAGGVVFFTCILMAILSYMHGDYLSAFYFSGLSGAILGFLRYNFNPASIFLGDGGSYFLGYIVAILAIKGSIKSQVGTLMLIPLLALGVPIFDTILSPIRRFIRGRGMFQPDKGHIHHAFLNMGLSCRKVVLIIYGITMALCILAILMMTLQNEIFESVFFALLLVGLIFLMRKLGYLEYLAFDKFYGWFQDVIDLVGISQRRRSFLSLQLSANESQNMDELWGYIIEALDMLKVHQAQLQVMAEPVREWKMKEYDYLLKSKLANSINGQIDCPNSLLKIEIPLRNNEDNIYLGNLILIKDLRLGHLKPYTIRRVESLRRTIVTNLLRLKKGFNTVREKSAVLHRFQSFMIEKRLLPAKHE